jgi:hypothetical protein
MKAVVCNLPWGHAHGDLGTCPERTGELVVGSLIAIHSGNKTCVRGFPESGRITPWEYYCNSRSIVAVAKFRGNFCRWSPVPTYDHTSSSWQLGNIVQIEPIACESNVGLWTLDWDLEEKVLANYRIAIS